MTQEEALEKIQREVESAFKVYHVEKDKDCLRLYVLNPDYKLVEEIAIKHPEWEISLKEKLGEQYVEIKPEKPEKERIWINLILLILTFLSTTYVGMSFYTKNKIWGGMVFSLSILFVLGSHEMGHYFTAKKWGIKTTLPYFIPAPNILGTFGAVIKQKSNCPNRKALFDMGVSGPMVGVLASVLVSYIGLKMPASAGKGYVEIGIPPLFQAVEILAHFNGKTISPVAFAGWVGMFLTCLNMIPAGQLDGGHVLRAMIGKASDQVSRIMPLLVLAVGYISDVMCGAGSIWIVWSLIVLFFSFAPHPPPIDDETKIDKKRYAFGIIAFLIALSCFTPCPFKFVK